MEEIPEAHVDAVMSRAVAVLSSDRLCRPLTRWMAYLPGTALPTVWREDSTAALSALRVALIKAWLPTIRELLMWERGRLANGSRIEMLAPNFIQDSKTRRARR
jgi:hypothetical protein